MTHLYRHFDKDGDLLYVGISLSAVARLKQHMDHSRWANEISRIEIEQFPTREAALFAELKAIQSEKPRHNIVHNYIQKKSHAEESREYLTQQIVNFDAVYTFQQVAVILKINTTAIQRIVQEGKLGSITLPLNKEGLSFYGTPFKEKKAISGWQLISYLESLHGEPI